jgi:hypothetical protein
MRDIIKKRRARGIIPWAYKVSSGSKPPRASIWFSHGAHKKAAETVDIGGKAEGPIQPEIGGGSAAASGVCGEEGLKGWGLAVADLKG